MPSLRKRPHEEVSDEKADNPKRDTPRKTVTEPSMLDGIRGMWQFANLYQWIMLFGKAIRMDDDFDIEVGSLKALSVESCVPSLTLLQDLEAECLKPFSTKLQDIGLSMLKFLSSHRGLTHDLFDEYSRRQFLAKAPTKNPFGPVDEPPLRFTDFDVYTKVCRTCDYIAPQGCNMLIFLDPCLTADDTAHHDECGKVAREDRRAQCYRSDELGTFYS
jgi:hypothetical protein